jgi:hypothetical protein
MSLISPRLSTLALSALLGLGTVAIAACVPNADGNEESTSDVEIVTMFVAPEKVECVGVAPQECLQVRYAPNEDYQLFYSSIEGFDYEPGYDYELLVQKTPVDNPPADGSSIQWTLVEVVSKLPASE